MQSFRLPDVGGRNESAPCVLCPVNLDPLRVSPGFRIVEPDEAQAVTVRVIRAVCAQAKACPMAQIAAPVASFWKKEANA